MAKKLLIFLIFTIFSHFSLAQADPDPLPESISPSTKKLRFFNIDLHISVIADIKNILESFGHEVVDWSISGHTWVFDRPQAQVDIVNANTWTRLSKEMCNEFYERYKDYLSQFDAFIVTYSGAFALLYEKFNKPIIFVNPTRYEIPFTLNPESWNYLNEYLITGARNNKIFLVSNNKGDQFYLEHFTGIKHEHIPSLCLYTHCEYTGNSPGFIVHSLGSGLMMQTTKQRFKNPGLIENYALPPRYKWNQLYDFQGIIHFPYNVSTMSLFEQYSANIPLFVPSKTFILSLMKEFPNDVLSQLSFFPLLRAPIPNTPGDPNNIADPEVVQKWIDSADFYDEENMPYIQYFDSFEHLENLLKTVNLREINQKMKAYNNIRKAKIYKQWSDLLEKIINESN